MTSVAGTSEQHLGQSLKQGWSECELDPLPKILPNWNLQLQRMLERQLVEYQDQQTCWLFSHLVCHSRS